MNIPLLILPHQTHVVLESPTVAEFAGRRCMQILEHIGLKGELCDISTHLNKSVPLVIAPYCNEEKETSEALAHWISRNENNFKEIWVFGSVGAPLNKKWKIRTTNFEKSCRYGLRDSNRKIPSVRFATHSSTDISFKSSEWKTLWEWEKPCRGPAVVRKPGITLFGFTLRARVMEQMDRTGMNQWFVSLLREQGFSPKKSITPFLPKKAKVPLVELRGICIHRPGHGRVFLLKTKERARLLSLLGFNAVYLNATELTAPFYLMKQGDSSTWNARISYLRKEVKIYRDHGLEAHTWVTPWAAGNHPALRHRFMQSPKGTLFPWLDPFIEENRILATETLVELCRSVPIDGLFYDYARFLAKTSHIAPR
jgi:hypothetical protein